MKAYRASTDVPAVLRDRCAFAVAQRAECSMLPRPKVKARWHPLAAPGPTVHPFHRSPRHRSTMPPLWSNPGQSRSRPAAARITQFAPVDAAEGRAMPQLSQALDCDGGPLLTRIRDRDEPGDRTPMSSDHQLLAGFNTIE